MGMGFNSTEIVDLSTVRVVEGKLLFDFTCPRCGMPQTGNMDRNELLDGKSFACSHVDVCGERNLHFSVHGIDGGTFIRKLRASGILRIEDVTAEDIDWGSGSYQDSSDVPLNETSRSV